MTFADIPVDEFRWNTESASRYSFVVRALDGGSFVDDQSIQFSIDSRPVEITSMSPDRGGPGTEVTLRGGGFGSIPKFTTVKFNGVVAEVDTASWSNETIKVIVPENAATGEVTVTNGEVTGKGGTFTVTKETITTESFAYQTNSSFGDLVMTANITFSLSAEVLDTWGDTGTNYYGYEIKRGEPASLSISASAELNTYSKTVTNQTTKVTTVTTYHVPRFVPLTDTEYADWPLSVSGNFEHSASDTGLAFTFGGHGDSVHASMVFEVTCDIRQYDEDGVLIDEILDNYYNARTVGIISLSSN